MRVAMTDGAVVQYVVVIVAMVLTCSTACFVRNCPVGGKRSLEEMTGIPAQRQCLRCGPASVGQCIGPNICCSTMYGCFMNTEESAICQRENDVTTPCQVEGAICGQNGEGYCVADSLCCNDEQCLLDDECRVSPHLGGISPENNRISPETIQYLKKLLFHQREFSGK